MGLKPLNHPKQSLPKKMIKVMNKATMEKTVSPSNSSTRSRSQLKSKVKVTNQN